MQYKKDLEKPKELRRWLRCEIGDDGKHVFIVLSTPEMIQNAVRFGDGRALYMDLYALGTAGRYTWMPPLDVGAMA
jgi:hypothetical protein